MRKVFAIVFLFLLILGPKATLVAEVSGEIIPAKLLRDTIKRVKIRVVAKEVGINYDSIFRSQSNQSNNHPNQKIYPGKKAVASNKPLKPASKALYRTNTRKPTSTVRSTVAAPVRPAGYGNSPNKGSETVKKSVNTSESEVLEDLGSTDHSSTGKSFEERLFAGSSKSADVHIPEAATTEETLSADTLPAVPQKVAQVRSQDAASVEPDNVASSVSSPVTDTSTRANKVSYMWIGLILILVGIVLGLVFGRTAFMVSIVGLVFLLIGFYIL